MTDYNRPTSTDYNRPASTATALGPNSIAALVGAAVVLISAFVAWLSLGDRTENSNGVPFSFLWDDEATSGLKLLIPLLIVVILIVVGVFAAGARVLTVIGAALAVIIPVLFLIQRSSLNDKAEAAGMEFGGFAPWLCLIGGLIALVGGVMGFANRAVN